MIKSGVIPGQYDQRTVNMNEIESGIEYCIDERFALVFIFDFFTPQLKCGLSVSNTHHTIKSPTPPKNTQRHKFFIILVAIIIEVRGHQAVKAGNQ